MLLLPTCSFVSKGHFRIFFFITGRSAPIYKVLSIDYSSALELVNKEYERMSFADLDLLEDLKVSLCHKQSRTHFTYSQFITDYSFFATLSTSSLAQCTSLLYFFYFRQLVQI